MNNRYRDNIPYREAPSTRWDAERFARESRGPPTAVDDDRRPPRRAPVFEEKRYYEEDRYGPRGQYSERKYFEEDDYYNDPRASGGALVPFRPERPSRPEGPPRPGLLRRQSSLDTFDRRPVRRVAEYDTYRGPPSRGTPIVERPVRREERDYPDDPYGDGGFREYREREWVSTRRRSASREREREERETDRETIVEDETVVEKEKPYPRKGKTRMPKRLVNTKVLYDLGYPFYEEDEKTILIERALGPENIDEVFTRSREIRETGTTRFIDAPPPRSSAGEMIREEKVVQEVRTMPLEAAPRSVREWDGLSAASSHQRKPSRSRRGSSGQAGEIKEIYVEKKIIEREVSPARTSKSRTSRRSGKSRRSAAKSSRSTKKSESSSESESESDESTTIIERKIIREQDIEDSRSVHMGPLALVTSNQRPRSDAEIKREIRELEEERRRIRREREYEREGTIVKVERRERSPSPKGEVIVRRDRDDNDVVEVKRDRRARSKSTQRAPRASTIKAMMYTLT